MPGNKGNSGAMQNAKCNLYVNAPTWESKTLGPLNVIHSVLRKGSYWNLWARISKHCPLWLGLGASIACGLNTAPALAIFTKEDQKLSFKVMEGFELNRHLCVQLTENKSGKSKCMCGQKFLTNVRQTWPMHNTQNAHPHQPVMRNKKRPRPRFSKTEKW